MSDLILWSGKRAPSFRSLRGEQQQEQEEDEWVGQQQDEKEEVMFSQDHQDQPGRNGALTHSDYLGVDIPSYGSGNFSRATTAASEIME